MVPNQPRDPRDARPATLGAAAARGEAVAKVLRIGCGVAMGGKRQKKMRGLAMDGSGTGMVINQTHVKQ
jgi:hypothetical protein